MMLTTSKASHSGEPESNSLTRCSIVAFAAVLVIVALYCRIRLLAVPLERDEGGFAYIGQQLLHGIPPFVSGNTKVLGGMHFAYAGMMALFGEHATAIHIGLLLVNMTSMVLIYLLARRILTVEAAVLTTGVYAYLSTSQAVLGVFTHATHFVMLFVLAGFLTLFNALEENRRMLFFASGISFGLAILMKQHGVFFCLFAFCFLVWKRRKQGAGLKNILAELALTGVGIVVPYLVICIYMAINGVFAEFWFWTVRYSLNYTGANSLSRGVQNLSHKMEPQFLYLKYVWLLAGIGIVAACCTRVPVRNRLFLQGFTLCSILATTPGFYFYRHYFVMMIPALALLTGVAYETCSIIEFKFNISAARLVALAVIAAAIFTGIFRERDYLFRLTPGEVSRTLYGNDMFSVSDEIASYLRENSDRHAKVAIIGSEPQIYFNAQRTAATDYIYMYSLDRPHADLTKMQDEMIREIEKSAPEYIVFVGVYDSWSNELAENKIIDWLDSYLVSYDLVGCVTVGGREESRIYWGAAAEDCQPGPGQYVSIFKRYY
jgi:hypothetical protein